MNPLFNYKFNGHKVRLNINFEPTVIEVTKDNFPFVIRLVDSYLNSIDVVFFEKCINEKENIWKPLTQEEHRKFLGRQYFIHDEWCVDDIFNAMKIKPEEATENDIFHAQEILDKLNHEFDAGRGINWDVINDIYEEYKNENKI